LSQKRKRRESKPPQARVTEEPSAESSDRKCIIAVRIRGQGGVVSDVVATLGMLHMPRKYNAIVLYSEPSILGMLRKVKDYVTWGEIEKKTLAMLLEERCRPTGIKELTAKYLKEKLQVASLEKLAEVMEKTEIPLGKLHKAGLPMVFRLHPPKGGFKGPTKRAFAEGGELGYRGVKISQLISRMI
jgi:large subunit ribosomal protein L30